MIPPFHEENYEHDEMAPSSVSHDSDYHFSSARAIPSKSGLGSLVYEDALLGKEAESAAEATSRQSKKAPLPHHYEPSTIAGITIGAFLLIFIGTGKRFPLDSAIKTISDICCSFHDTSGIFQSVNTISVSVKIKICKNSCCIICKLLLEKSWRNYLKV